MASKGNERHLKRLTRSRSIAIPKKREKWLVKPQAGAHKGGETIPLLVLVRDILKLANTAKEAKKIINNAEIHVDGKAVRNYAYGVGLLDVISIPKTKKHYQIYAIKEVLKPLQISEDSAKLKSCRIMNKLYVKGSKVLLALHDGKNLLIEKEEDRFSVGDTVRLLLPERKIENFIKLEKGVNCYIYKGKHSGEIAVLEKIIEQPGGTPSDAKLIHEKEELITRKDFLIPVAKEFKFQLQA